MSLHFLIIRNSFKFAPRLSWIDPGVFKQQKELNKVIYELQRLQMKTWTSGQTKKTSRLHDRHSMSFSQLATINEQRWKTRKISCLLFNVPSSTGKITGYMTVVQELE